MIRLLAAAALSLLLALSVPAAAQPRDFPIGANPLWTETETHIASVPAGTAFPRRAGTLELTGTRDMGGDASEIDSTAQYRSADRRIIGSVYVYLPGLAHPGLASFATEQAILLNSTSRARLVSRRLAAAGGHPDMAIRDDYENYMDGVSSAAFARAGRWQIKIRVTGPADRRSEVKAAMDALLAGIQFGPESPARPASPITVSDCPSTQARPDAVLLPDPSQEDLAGMALMIGSLDGAGIAAIGTDSGSREHLPSWVPAELCRSGHLNLGRQTYPVLTSGDGPAEIFGRTRLVAILSDSGTWIEVVQLPRRDSYLMLYHQIGATHVLGSYDRIPSNRQIEAMMREPANEAGRFRASVILRPNGQQSIELRRRPEQAEPVT